MSNKIQYRVGNLDLNLKSATSMITISKGDTIEFDPVVNTKNLKSEVFSVCLTQNKQKAYFKLKGAAVKKIVDNSIKEITKHNEELFELDQNQEKFHELAEVLYTKQSELFSLLKKVDLAANSEEVITIVNNLQKILKPLISAIDFNNLTKEQEKSIKAVDKLSFELSSSNKNIVSTQSPYKYLPKLENFAYSNFEDAMGWLKKDPDIYMNHATLCDFVDIVTISSVLNEGQLKECREKISNLDTYVRDGIDGQFWEEWVCTVQFNKNDLLAQQEQYEKIINSAANKLTKKAKIK